MADFDSGSRILSIIGQGLGKRGVQGKTAPISTSFRIMYGRELLADRANQKFRLRPVGNLFRQVGGAVSLVEQSPPLPNHEGRPVELSQLMIAAHQPIEGSGGGRDAWTAPNGGRSVRPPGAASCPKRENKRNRIAMRSRMGLVRILAIISSSLP